MLIPEASDGSLYSCPGLPSDIDSIGSFPTLLVIAE